MACSCSRRRATTVYRMVLTLWKQCQVGGQCPGKSRAPFPALFALWSRKPRYEQQELGKVGPVVLESCNTIYLFSWNMAWVVIYSNTAINAAAAVVVFHYPECSKLHFPARTAPVCARVLEQTQAGEASPGALGLAMCSYRGSASAWRTLVNERATPFWLTWVCFKCPESEPTQIEKTKEVIVVWGQRNVPLDVLLTDWTCLCPSITYYRQNYRGAGVGRHRSAAWLSDSRSLGQGGKPLGFFPCRL